MKQTTWRYSKGIFLIIVLLGCAQIALNTANAGEVAGAQTKLAPAIVAVNPVKMEKEAKVVIMGAGFQAKQVIRVIFKTPAGVFNDLDYALEPKPIADNEGAWVTTWKCGRHLKNIKEGVYTILIATQDYRFLAHTPIVFFK